MKFTPYNGLITVKLKINEELDKESAKSDNYSQNKLISFEISIIDNGGGISEEGLEILFMNFNKLEENKE